jgi:replicative superfamily II helicase
MQYSDLHKKFLQDLGRTDVGRTLCEILELTKAYYSSIATIDTTRSTDAQIEGRKIVGEILDEITSTIQTQKRNVKPLAQDDFT